MANKPDAPVAEQAVPAEEQPHAAMLSAEEIQGEIKPLSENAFLAFFQRIYRAWLGWWYGMCDKHPKGTKLIGQFVVMFVFSNAVTIWQLLVMLFLPYAFAAVWDVPFVWPAIAIPWEDAMGTALNYAIFNEPVKFLATISGEQQVLLASTAETVQQYVDAGYTLQMSGVGNFIAFEIAVFTAQCINFPLQRNITFRSKGNPVVQAIWYFIGWLAISVALNALWGIMNPLMLWWNWPDPVIQLLKTVITGGISMIIFFFIFLIIFPDANKVAKKARAKADAAKESGNAEAAAAAELNAVRKEEDAKLTNARQARYKAISQANSRAVAFGSVVKNAEKAKAEAEELAAAANDEASTQKAEEAKAKAAEIEARIPDYQQKASDAIAAKHEAIAAYEAAIEEVKAARQARGEDVSKVA